MVRKLFFCGNHREEAQRAAADETRSINNWHVAGDRDRKLKAPTRDPQP
jgi:hypothetical protein